MLSRKLLNYQIERVVGEGGMGRVYLAQDATTGQKVAIKELYAHLAANPSLRKRFEKEAQVMSTLQHPHIVRLHHYIENEEGLFLAMEYIEGTPLDEHILKVTGPVSEPKMIEIMTELLDAFQYAHDRGIIHRDIKPSNILFTKTHQVKVLDFGIAKITDDNDERTKLTKTGTRMGTVVFMSPEQVRGREVDNRTDIYALGILLHYMATGKPPYDDTTLSEFEINIKIVQEPLPRASEVYPFVSQKIQSIIDKATAKDPADRYASCKEFKADLLLERMTPVLGNGQQKTATESIQPQPQPKKKGKTGVLAVAVAVLLLITLAGYKGYIFNEKSKNTSSDLKQNDTKDIKRDKVALQPDSIPDLKGEDTPTEQEDRNDRNESNDDNAIENNSTNQGTKRTVRNERKSNNVPDERRYNPSTNNREQPEAADTIATVTEERVTNLGIKHPEQVFAFELKFCDGTHHALLIYDEITNKGIMRVSFYSKNQDKYIVVQENIIGKEMHKGYILEGFNVTGVYGMYGSVESSEYRPDKIYLYEKKQSYLTDDSGNRCDIVLKQISDYDDSLFEKFHWNDSDAVVTAIKKLQ